MTTAILRGSYPLRSHTHFVGHTTLYLELLLHAVKTQDGASYSRLPTSFLCAGLLSLLLFFILHTRHGEDCFKGILGCLRKILPHIVYFQYVLRASEIVFETGGFQ